MVKKVWNCSIISTKIFFSRNKAPKPEKKIIKPYITRTRYTHKQSSRAENSSSIKNDQNWQLDMNKMNGSKRAMLSIDTKSESYDSE